MTVLTWILVAAVVGGLLLAAVCLLFVLGGFFLARLAEALVRRGAAVRVERAAPAGLTFRQKLTVRGGEVTEDA